MPTSHTKISQNGFPTKMLRTMTSLTAFPKTKMERLLSLKITLLFTCLQALRSLKRTKSNGLDQRSTWGRLLMTRRWPNANRKRNCKLRRRKPWGSRVFSPLARHSHSKTPWVKATTKWLEVTTRRRQSTRMKCSLKWFALATTRDLKLKRKSRRGRKRQRSWLPSTKMQRRRHLPRAKQPRLIPWTNLSWSRYQWKTPWTWDSWCLFTLNGLHLSFNLSKIGALEIVNQENQYGKESIHKRMAFQLFHHQESIGLKLDS